MGRPKDRQRTLTLAELNRATLARQLLLERKKLSPLKAIEHLVGMQAQWSPAPYVGLWSRIAGFRRETLERAVLRGEVLKPTLMRGTLHLVTKRDYPVFWWALRDMPTWYQPHHLELALGHVEAVRERGSLTTTEMLAWLAERHPELDDRDHRRMFYALRRRAHLLHAPETALFKLHGGSVVFRAHDDPAERDVLAARTELVHRYLAAFGPASKADVARWSGLRVRDFEHALAGLPTHRSDDGRVLFDVPRARLPPADTPVPVRFLPKWDNVLLAFDDRRRMLPPELKEAVFATNGDVKQTVLVDGRVAATWDNDVRITYLATVTRTQKAEVAAEAERLQAWLA